MIRYRFYPSLLNAYGNFQSGKMTGTDLLNVINRIALPVTTEQAKGISFENAVIKGENEEMFPVQIIKEVRALLPRPMVATQVYCEYQFEDVLIYGYVDVIGRSLAVDIKTTRLYKPDLFINSHQNFYLPALKHKGIKILRYAITDFENVYEENYGLQTDFTFQLRQIKSFCQYIEAHREAITDRKIFGGL